MSGLDRLNALPPPGAREALLACCASPEWARRMAEARPFADRGDLLARADALWWAVGEAEWLAAFRGHPRIGERETAAPQTGRAAGWSAAEQAGVGGAAEAVRRALAEGNRAYEARFGFVFLICATGRSAEEMLQSLRVRLANDPPTELRTAAAGQARITAIRLRKLIADGADA
jgi:2-oxo-4-hydroxy-4-carboxy-5-ureidoimidazoline decarboxylase